MQWIVGQEYRTRDGKPAVVLEIMPDGVMFGRYQSGALGRWYPNAWREDGRDLDGDDSAFDLIPPRPPVVVSDAVARAGHASWNGGTDAWDHLPSGSKELWREIAANTLLAYLDERGA